jgi:hypothetical protein
MSNPTTPFGWQMPTAVDLVTDLPADFAVFGQAVATSMADLLGGTTGQILSKASATDMDFTWTSANPGDITGVTAGVGISGGGTSGDVTVTNSMATAIDAKGDLIAGTGADTFSRLAVGTNGQVLKADSTAGTGLAWGSVSAYPESASNFVATTESTTSASYTGLTTAQAVTLTTGTKVLVIVSSELRTTTSGTSPQMSYAISGATTSASSDAYAIRFINPGFTDPGDRQSAVSFRTVTAGSNTFTAQFKRDSSTASFLNREITVINLGS